jgi:hypothetical protein
MDCAGKARRGREAVKFKQVRRARESSVALRLPPQYKIGQGELRPETGSAEKSAEKL